MTQEEIVLEGKTYVSSKRAAQLRQYAQDYIGQMCRAGNADCRRVNGLWYVTLESLDLHKAASAEAKARAFENMPPREPSPYEETVLSFSGEEYVSSKHGAELTGYNPDYITQLARSGKVRARQMGNRWYVAHKDLIENKERNDALLAEVQAEAVGFARPAEKTESVPINREPKLLNYKPDNAPLMPPMPEAVRQQVRVEPVVTEKRQEIAKFYPDYHIVATKVDQSIVKSAGKKGKKAYAHLVAASVLVLVLVAGGYTGVRRGYFSGGDERGALGAVSASMTDPAGGVWGILLGLATDVVSYRRVE